jgi:hypothetical protein
MDITDIIKNPIKKNSNVANAGSTKNDILVWCQ